MHPRVGLKKGRDRLGLVRGQVIHDDVDFSATGLGASMSPRNSMNAALVWRGTVCPTISPVRVLRAAYNQRVPCR
jgi:hypothetical protein